MNDLYEYRKYIHRHWYNKFRRRRLYTIVFFGLILIALAVILVDISKDNSSKPDVSAVENVTYGDKLISYKTDYFSFQDNNKWVLNKNASTKTKFSYTSFHGVQPQYQMIIYVNEDPIPLYTAVSRLLPVRLVNDNSFDVTNVFGPCGTLYKPSELHNVKTITIEGAQMLCDPDTPQYSVILSEVNGDWRLNLRRADGITAKYVITYRDLTFNPGPSPLLQIAKTFKAL